MNDRSLLLAVCAAGLTLGNATPAAADDGPSAPLGLPERPSQTIIRAIALGPGLPPLGPTLPECLVVVGGFNSTPGDSSFDDLLSPFGDRSRYRIHHFGADQRFDYDTRGALNPNAKALRAQVRQIAPGCAAIHVLAHSMGGVVADRAFARGLSGSDRVATYIALASPHNGATAARVVQHVAALDPAMPAVMQVAAARLGLGDPTSVAAKELAKDIRSPRPPRGVSTERVRLTSDLLIRPQDHADPRYPVREYAPDLARLEGHDGSIHHEVIRRRVAETIERDRVPADDRGLGDHVAATAVGIPTEALAAVGLGAVALFGALVAAHLGLMRRTWDFGKSVVRTAMDRYAR